MMSAADVIEVLDLLDSAGIDCWLEGGWGVDALLEEQTREHDDIDMVVELDKVPLMFEILGGHGFTLVHGSPPKNFVLGDGRDRRVDVHPVRFDERGRGLYIMDNGETWPFPAQGFTGRGTILKRPVKCMSPEVQVICHSDYELDDDDRRDMQALRDHFGVKLLPQQE